MGLANNFNYSITKKRMIMMTKTNNSKRRMLRLLLILPAIALALALNLKCTSENISQNNDGINLSDQRTTIKTANQTDNLDKTITDEQVFVIVEDMPQFPGGDKALQTWISDHVIYPKIAHEKNIEGRVYIGFVVTKNGNIDRVKIMRGASPSLDAEALRVISAMPTWKPGKQRGKAVSVSYTVPINFALN